MEFNLKDYLKNKAQKFHYIQDKILLKLDPNFEFLKPTAKL